MAGAGGHAAWSIQTRRTHCCTVLTLRYKQCTVMRQRISMAKNADSGRPKIAIIQSEQMQTERDGRFQLTSTQLTEFYSDQSYCIYIQNKEQSNYKSEQIYDSTVTGVQEEGPHLIPPAIASQLSIMHSTYSDSACSQPRFAFCNHASPHLSPSPFHQWRDLQDSKPENPDSSPHPFPIKLIPNLPFCPTNFSSLIQPFLF